MGAQVAAVPRKRRLGRLERAALRGVIVREIVNYSSFWRSSTFSSTVDPTIYLLAFGFGFGSMFQRAGQGNYIQFLAPGVIIMSVLFTSIFSGIEVIWDLSLIHI